MNWEDKAAAPADLDGSETYPVNKAGVSVYSTIDKIATFLASVFDAIGTAASAIADHLSAYDHDLIDHTNRAALDAVSGVNTGDDAGHAALAPLNNPAFTGGISVSATAPQVATVWSDNIVYAGYTVLVGDSVRLDQSEGLYLQPGVLSAIDPNILHYYEQSTWTPSDVSGAALTFTGVANCYYTRIGFLVFLHGTLTYPTTADTSTAAIGGLPFNPAFESPGDILAASATYGVIAAVPGSKLQFYNAPGTAARTNAVLTGATVKFSICYRVA